MIHDNEVSSAHEEIRNTGVSFAPLHSERFLMLN